MKCTSMKWTSMYIGMTHFMASVYRHINEDKRKTENQVVMFDIMNEIDNCPVSISV